MSEPVYRNAMDRYEECVSSGGRDCERLGRALDVRDKKKINKKLQDKSYGKHRRPKK